MMTQSPRPPLAISAKDRLHIEQEHERLAAFMHDLRDTCSELDSSGDCRKCGREKSASCQGLLVSFQFDFLDLVEDHFTHEENIMRDHLASPEDSEYFRQHQAEHARLLHEIRTSLIPKCTELSKHGQTAAAIRLLYDKITEIFSEHACAFDDTLLK